MNNTNTNNNENVYFTLIENEIIKKDDLDIHLSIIIIIDICFRISII